MLITDPDDLNDAATSGASEVYIDTATKTIQLTETGNLSSEGVTIKALYSFLKEEWRDDPQGKTLTAYPFPMVPITDESYELIGGWNFADSASQFLIRTGGWTVRNAAGQPTEMWAGIVGLGNVEADDQIYYDQGEGATNAELQGQINQAVQILSDPDGNGSYDDGFDYRNEFVLYVREQGQLFGQASIEDIGVASMGPIAYRFPISTASDLKISVDDTGIDSTGDGVADVAPYDGMSITYHQTAVQREIGGTDYDFGITIDGNNGTAEQIYEFVQWSLRQTADVDSEGDSPSQIGNLSDQLLRFVGDNLETLSAANDDGGGDGVYVDNFQPLDRTRLQFTDNTGSAQAFPFDAVLTLNFNDNLVADASSRFWVYFADPNAIGADGDEWDTAGAVLLDDTTGADITGDVSGSSSLQFNVAYDTQVQAGHAQGSDIDVIVVALGLGTGQYVRATGTITRSVSNSISLVAPLERNFENAA